MTKNVYFEKKICLDFKNRLTFSWRFGGQVLGAVVRTGILYQIQFPTSTRPGRQQAMAGRLGSLPPMGQIWVERLVQPWLLQTGSKLESGAVCTCWVDGPSKL